MANTIGTPSKPTATYHAFGGSSQVNQEAELLTMPKKGRLLTLGSWVGGWSATCRIRLCVWDGSTKALLGQTNQITAANEGAAGDGNVSLYTGALVTPVELAKGATFYCGFARHPDDAHQVSVGPAGGGPHYHGRSGTGWPNDFANAGSFASVDRRVGSYVADYQPIPGAWILRSGVWVEAESVMVYRSGAWVEAESIELQRSGAWVESQ